MLGNFVLSSGYYDAYFTKAQKVRRLIKTKTEEMLKNNDVLILPTSPSTAFNIGEIKDPIKMYLQDIFTVHANITGAPAISLPIGTHSNNLPFGIQLMANSFQENTLFEVSNLLIEKYLEKSQQKNFEIWPILGQYVWPNPVYYDTHHEEVEHLKDWIEQRMTWLKTWL